MDYHAHFVYGVDDGARTREEMFAMLDAAAADGVTRLFATSHSTPGMEPFPLDVYQRHLDFARAYCAEKGYDLMPSADSTPSTTNIRSRSAPVFTGSRSSVRTTRTTLSFPKTRIITQSSASKRSGRSAFRRIWPTAIGSAAIWVCR